MAISISRLTVLPLALVALGLVGGCDEGDVIGPKGGVVVSDDGRLVLEVPADALSEDLEISIHVVDDGPEGTARAYAIEPQLTQLSLPATLEYTWTVDGDDTLSRKGMMSDPLLVIERGEEWRVLPDRHVDTDAQVVVASTHYLGVIAIVE